MGRVVGPWGVRGWVKVVPYGDGPDGLVAQRTWWLPDERGAWQPRAIDQARAHSGTVVAAIAGISTPEAAAVLKGRDVAVPRSALPRPGANEVYLGDLVGLGVENAAGVPLGTVVAVEDYGAHPLIRVRAGEGKGGEDALVPLVTPILRSVDLAGRRIVVDWEPGY